MSEMPYIIAAYSISWLTVLGYAMYLFLKTHAAKQRLAEVRSQMSTDGVR
jgi:CcmD family protein